MAQVGEVQVAVCPRAAAPKQLRPSQGQLDWHNSPASCSQPAHSPVQLKTEQIKRHQGNAAFAQPTSRTSTLLEAYFGETATTSACCLHVGEVSAAKDGSRWQGGLRLGLRVVGWGYRLKGLTCKRHWGSLE